MRLRWGALLVVLGGLACLTWPIAREPAFPTPGPAPELARVPDRGVTAEPDDPPPPAFVADAVDVRQACDLDLDLRCDRTACAAILTAPDLDAIGGWLSLVFDSPRFVLSTAARDLGVPARALPCGSAVERLVGQSGVVAVERPDGTEIWCTLTGDDDRGRALCDDLAADRGLPDAGFGRDDLRRLSFSDPR